MSNYFIKKKSLLFLIGFFCFYLLSAQDQIIADSLSIIYHENTLEGEAKLKLPGARRLPQLPVPGTEPEHRMDFHQPRPQVAVDS